MTSQEIRALLERQRAYYHSGATLPVPFRIAQLKKLYAAIQKYEAEISAALTADLGKSRYEGFMCESGMALSEISHMIRHTKQYAKRKAVPSPLAQFPSRSYRQPVPYGNTLIMSPWNYPFLLTIDPLATPSPRETQPSSSPPPTPPPRAGWYPGSLRSASLPSTLPW
jgi:aldehyde dehydrogenase (NAD+)